jgi:hypothetical protein
MVGPGKSKEARGMQPDCATHIIYANNFTSKLIQIKGTVLTFAPVEKLERGSHGPLLAGI